MDDRDASILRAGDKLRSSADHQADPESRPLAHQLRGRLDEDDVLAWQFAVAQKKIVERPERFDSLSIAFVGRDHNDFRRDSSEEQLSPWRHSRQVRIKQYTSIDRNYRHDLSLSTFCATVRDQFAFQRDECTL